MATPKEIAEWMLAEYKKKDELIQHRAATQIKEQFGEDHLYKNKNGNWAIVKPILDAFRALTPEGVVWSRDGQLWRKRRPNDPPGKRMVS
jgi:exonuclease I